MADFLFSADDAFILQRRGIVFRGRLMGGAVSAGDRATLSVRDGGLAANVGAIELDRKLVPTAIAGVEMGILLIDFDRQSVNDRIQMHVDESNCNDVPTLESLLDFDFPVALRGMDQ